VLADIKANRESAKQAVIRNLYQRELADHDLDTKLDLLRHDAWLEQPLLRRSMRRQWKRGKTSVDNHIVLDAQCYAVRTDVSGKAWLDVTGLTPLERLAIPLANNAAISGTIRRLILHGTGRRRGKRGARGGRLDIHHAYRRHRRASRGPAACV
jgi:hypothetical protein